MGMTSTDLVTSVTIHHAPHIRFGDYILREQQAAIAGLLHHNVFAVHEFDNGPYALTLSMDGDRLILSVGGDHISRPKTIPLSVRPYRKLIKDYFMICDSYDKAYRKGDAARLEPIDMARRGLHDEGATLLQSRLNVAGITTDHNTARNIFTLICILHIGGVRQW